MLTALSNTQNGLPAYSNNTEVGEQPPPSYNEVMGMAHVASGPSAPFTDEFSLSIFNSSKRVRFEYNSSDDAGYSFFIRDENGSLQAKGYGFNFDISVQNMNGTPLMSINKIETVELNGHTFHKFDIFYKSVAIGIVNVGVTAPVETSLQIINSCVNNDITVRSFQIGQFAIFRVNSETQLCNIQIPVGEDIDENDFSGTVIFHTESAITTEEQLLCTAAAIAFKVIKKQSKEEDGNHITAYFIGFFIIVIFIIILVKKSQ
ncbi:uncharacterized protein LOC119073992 [Bradysia coprophila]|uniref:uncharacterized protein LOC119073992 n=1 Tax=Bradysia coprophila TaxID=38358 RepID=UPI00187DB2B4|nr:uncharacterized protein LOC119073992 [Bradysia coprophila]